MDTRLRISGHPIQPVLVTFPVGLFACAVIFDVGRLVGAPGIVGEVGYWTAVAGLVATGLTVVAGLVDLWDVPPGPTRRAVVTFNLVNAVMAGVFLVICLIRAAGNGSRLASGGMVVVEILALGVGALGVRLGAGLMRRFDTAADGTAAADGTTTAGTTMTTGRTAGTGVGGTAAASGTGAAPSNGRVYGTPRQTPRDNSTARTSTAATTAAEVTQVITVPATGTEAPAVKSLVSAPPTTKPAAGRGVKGGSAKKSVAPPAQGAPVDPERTVDLQPGLAG